MSRNTQKIGSSKRRKVALVCFGLTLTAIIAASWLDRTSIGELKLSGPQIPYSRLASEKTDPYLVRGKPPEKSGEIWAARRWPNVRSCLVGSERKSETPDLRKMDWSKMRWKADIEVCLFRVASSISTPEGMRDWFMSQGMQYVEVTERKKLLNVRPEDVREVAAINRFSTGETYRASPIPWRYWIMFISRGENFTVWHLDNGGVFGTHYSDNNTL